MKILKGKESPYKEGSARAKLLTLAIKSGTTEKFLKAAKKPTGGPATDYLSLFVRDGAVKLAKSAAAGK
jgi:hypothetical protein